MEERVSNSELHKHIDYYVMIIRGFLHSSQISDIMEKTKNLEWKNEKTLDYDVDIFNDDVVDANNILMPMIGAAVKKYIMTYNFTWFKNWNGYTRTKWLRYNVNQNMNLHYDHKNNLFGENNKGIPLLSVVGLLNDDFEGGEFIMYGYKKADLKAGDLVIFPSNFIYPHEVTTVTKGTRYSYASWAW